MTLELEDWWTINERVNKDQTYYMQIGDDPNPERLGVFFSFPWRITNETGVADFGEYLWNQDRIQQLAFDIRERLGPMLFGCRNLKKVRLILTHGKNKNDNFVFEFRLMLTWLILQILKTKVFSLSQQVK